MSNAIQKTAEESAFEMIQRKAKMLASSELIPENFRGKIADCAIAIDMANRTGLSGLAILQNMYIVHGKPSWSSQIMISAINQCGRFKPLKYKFDGEGDQIGCTAYTKDIEDGEVLKGPRVTIKMAKDEGWYSKRGSKWQTMPQLMLSYRAATFFGRLYCPDVLMGMQTREEVIDITPKKIAIEMPECDALDAEVNDVN